MDGWKFEPERVKGSVKPKGKKESEKVNIVEFRDIPKKRKLELQTFFFYSVNHLSSQRHDFTHKCFSSLFTALYLLEMTFFSLLGQNTNMLCRMPGDGLSFFLRRLASVRLFSSVLTNRAACVDICGSVRDRSITDNRI